MSKIKLALAVVVLMVVSNSAYAVGSVWIDYYTDATFTTLVGIRYTPDGDCPSDDTPISYGITTNCRIVYLYPECYAGGDPIAYSQCS